MNDILELSISDIQRGIQSKKFSIKELTLEYIKRINIYDKCESGLNSVLEINPDAIEAANRLDMEKNHDSSPLYGVSILIKDNMNTKENMHTSAGSLALANSYTPDDAPLITELRNQGAIILGKTNMTEFGNYMTKDMPGGYSSRGGQVFSPYDKKENPFGSSSGSAVAVTSNFCTISIGTDTCNSIIAPAKRNGIVGFRPSSGTISNKGIIPISFTLDTAGPMTRTVKDCAITFASITHTKAIEFSHTSLKERHIGINEYNLKTLSDEEINRIENIIHMLEKAGATIRKLNIPPTKNVMEIMHYEFKYSINSYLSSLPKDYPVKTLADIISFNNNHPKEALKYGQSYLLDAEENTIGDLSEERYKQIMNERLTDIAIMKENLKDIDACLLPYWTNIAPYTGLPAIAIPCGLLKNGLPFGIQLMAIDDFKLIDTAYCIEQVVGERVNPIREALL